ncbi:MAG: polyprenyl synthetase family protein [Gemmatimonadota bacterium]
MEAKLARIDAALQAFVSRELEGIPQATAAPIRSAVLSPGKRIRPLLVLAAYEGAGGTREEVATLACAGELVHAYSLVHDDLPCMDNDVLRRGQPTLHVRYGEAAAVVAGAALMPMAVRAVLTAGQAMGLPDETVRSLLLTLAEASGASGMVGGQLLDLRAEGRRVSAERLERIHTGKTARLIAACVVMGGLAAGADDSVVECLRRFGLRLGLAFQAVDDILDVTGSDVELGKPSGRDRDLAKATYPAVLGMDGAEHMSRRLATAALGELEMLSGADELRNMALYVIERRS